MLLKTNNFLLLERNHFYKKRRIRSFYLTNLHLTFPIIQMKCQATQIDEKREKVESRLIRSIFLSKKDCETFLFGKPFLRKKREKMERRGKHLCHPCWTLIIKNLTNRAAAQDYFFTFFAKFFPHLRKYSHVHPSISFSLYLSLSLSVYLLLKYTLPSLSLLSLFLTNSLGRQLVEKWQKIVWGKSYFFYLLFQQLHPLFKC